MYFQNVIKKKPYKNSMGVDYGAMNSTASWFYHLSFYWNRPSNYSCEKHSFIGVFRKMCSENIQQIYRRTPMPKCDFNKVARRTPKPKCHFNKVAKQITLLHECSLVNLLCIFRTPFSKNTYGGQLLSCFRNLLWHKVLPKPRHYAQLKSKLS